MLRIYKNHSAKFDNPQDLKNYCFGGRGVVTLENPKTKIHHTYHIKKPRNEDEFPDDVYFIYAVHMMGDTNKCFYIGMIERGKFRLTRASRFDRHHAIVKGAHYLMQMMENPGAFIKMNVYHEGMCSVCGRPLTSPASLKRGVGPRCWAYLKDTLPWKQPNPDG
ncbi:DUF6011 domain-containing protein [uncultured Duncaniella sp.]|uniref:DUF6011 domain-containing protein n=1 Tax=uncultured Duncaniella sp. TaxID=2768039 RepID=UPI0026243B14|nr:DUF6011 domain-containing protein [uncultured Duncaniella sp.]